MTSIKVAVRCRPLFENERPASGLDIQGKRILLDSKTYDPDYTFTSLATQEELYGVCKPIVQSVKDGCNGTVMVYGQTGTGKTYTMLGNDEVNNSNNNIVSRRPSKEEAVESAITHLNSSTTNPNIITSITNNIIVRNSTNNKKGLVHFIIADMLDHVQQRIADGISCALTLSMIEIYNEKMTDMLSVNGENEVTLINGFPRIATKVTLCSLEDAIMSVNKGLAWRHTASTLMNERSSRSHVVFIIDLEEINQFTEQADVAHLFMVDLAGSESLKKSLASGTVANEAGKINRSLLALKSVLLALSNTNEATRPGHVPYRDSKLTELLQDSIGGTARTLMIACISSNGRDIEETKSTLMYAVKARSIRNASNTEREKLLIRLRSMEVENQKLRNRLQERVNEKGGYFVSKEEHESNERREEECVELKSNVELLLQQHRNSETREHISESQTKVLQLMIKSKQQEIDTIKSEFYAAIRKFDLNARELERVVESSTRHAHHIVQTESLQQGKVLNNWKESLLRVAEGNMPNPQLLLESLEELMVTSTSREDSEKELEEEEEYEEQEEREQFAKVSESKEFSQVTTLNINDCSNSVNQGESNVNSVLNNFFSDADRTIAQTVRRIHKSFIELAQQFKLTYDEHCLTVKSIEQHRREAMQRVCAEIKRLLDDNLEHLRESEERAQIDFDEAFSITSTRVNQLQQQQQEQVLPFTDKSKSKFTSIASSLGNTESTLSDVRCTWMLPLQQISRNVCISTIRSIEPLLPSTLQPSVSEPVQRAISSIPAKYCRKLAMMSATNLQYISSVPSEVSDLEQQEFTRHNNKNNNNVNNNNSNNSVTGKVASPILSPLLTAMSPSATNVLLNNNNNNVNNVTKANKESNDQHIASNNNDDEDDDDYSDYDNDDELGEMNSKVCNDSVVHEDETDEDNETCTNMRKTNANYLQHHNTIEESCEQQESRNVSRSNLDKSKTETSAINSEREKRKKREQNNNVNNYNNNTNTNTNGNHKQKHHEQHNNSSTTTNNNGVVSKLLNVNKHDARNAKHHSLSKSHKKTFTHHKSTTNLHSNGIDNNMFSKRVIEHSKMKSSEDVLLPPSRSTIRSRMETRALFARATENSTRQSLHSRLTYNASQNQTPRTSSVSSLDVNKTNTIINDNNTIDNNNNNNSKLNTRKGMADQSYKRSRTALMSASLTSSPLSRCESKWSATSSSLSSLSPSKSLRKRELSSGKSSSNSKRKWDNIDDVNGEKEINGKATSEPINDENKSLQVSPSRRLSDFS